MGRLTMRLRVLASDHVWAWAVLGVDLRTRERPLAVVPIGVVPIATVGGLTVGRCEHEH